MLNIILLHKCKFMLYIIIVKSFLSDILKYFRKYLLQYEYIDLTKNKNKNYFVTQKYLYGPSRNCKFC